MGGRTPWSCGLIHHALDRKVGGSKADFVRLLSKYYTESDWFAKAVTKAPLTILMDDGFIQYDAVNRRFLIAK